MIASAAAIASAFPFRLSSSVTSSSCRRASVVARVLISCSARSDPEHQTARSETTKVGPCVSTGWVSENTSSSRQPAGNARLVETLEAAPRHPRCGPVAEAARDAEAQAERAFPCRDGLSGARARAAGSSSSLDRSSTRHSRSLQSSGRPATSSSQAAASGLDGAAALSAAAAATSPTSSSVPPMPFLVQPGEQPPRDARPGRPARGHAQVELVTGDARAQRSEQRRRARSVLRTGKAKPEADLGPAGRKLSNHRVPLRS